MPPVTRVTQDSHIGHASPTPSPFHSTPYASGSSNVLTNGTQTVRIGDVTACGELIRWFWFCIRKWYPCS